MRGRFWLTLLVVAAWWSLYGVASTSQWISMEGVDGEVMPLRQAAMMGFASAWLWIPLTMVLLWCVQRFPIERGRVLGSVLVTLLVIVAIVAARATIVVALNDWIHWYQELPAFAEVFVTSLSNNFLLLWLMVGAAHALLFAARARQRERQAEQLEAKLLETRLDALSAQLNPHFLFNALNSIAEMVHRDADAADRMLVGLGELLRGSLEHRSAQPVPLREELALLRHYLGIEQVRLGERLSLEWRIAGDVEAALVPPLLLQPLVENAVVHALSLRNTPGRLRIDARGEGGILAIDIADDGGERASRTHHGSGLANLRSRLEILYGGGEWLRLERNDAGGTTARLRLPLRFRDAGAPGDAGLRT